MTSAEFDEFRVAKMPLPFAYNGGDGVDDSVQMYAPGESEKSGVTFQFGFDWRYSSDSGNKLTIGDMNGLGNLVSNGGRFSQLGGFHTFDAHVCELIGGYPLGAVLFYWNGKYVRKVRSLKANNKVNFTVNPATSINGDDWEYVDEHDATYVMPRMFCAESSRTPISLGPEGYAAPDACAIEITGMGFSKGSVHGETEIQMRHGGSQSWTTVGVVAATLTDDDLACVWTHEEHGLDLPWLQRSDIVPGSVAGNMKEILLFLEKGDAIRLSGEAPAGLVVSRMDICY